MIRYAVTTPHGFYAAGVDGGLDWTFGHENKATLLSFEAAAQTVKILSRLGISAAAKSVTTTTERERTLLDAAEEVLARWSVVRAGDGKLGSCGLPEALMILDAACQAYEPEEVAA